MPSHTYKVFFEPSTLITFSTQEPISVDKLIYSLPDAFFNGIVVMNVDRDFTGPIAAGEQVIIKDRHFEISRQVVAAKSPDQMPSADIPEILPVNTLLILDAFYKMKFVTAPAGNKVE